ncbi:MAG: hypothetical protein ACFB4I_12135 [Cyanophyceae cyanobacterium]
MPYHERRFVIWEALSRASSVMYLDADVRICAPVPPLHFLPGLTARSCGSLQEHLNKQLNKHADSPKFQHKKQVIDKMAARVGVELKSTELKFINEFLFVVTADEGREYDFLKTWGELAIYADTLGMHKHPTYAMALAAGKSHFPVYRSEMAGLDFFDDRIERTKIRKGQTTPEAKIVYFEKQRQIERSGRKFFQPFSTVFQKIALLYNRIRVQITFSVSPSALVDYPQDG